MSELTNRYIDTTKQTVTLTLQGLFVEEATNPLWVLHVNIGDATPEQLAWWQDRASSFFKHLLEVARGLAASDKLLIETSADEKAIAFDETSEPETTTEEAQPTPGES